MINKETMVFESNFKLQALKSGVANSAQPGMLLLLNKTTRYNRDVAGGFIISLLFQAIQKFVV